MSYEKNDDYVDVAARIAEFRTKHPEGSLQPVDPAQPFRVETIDAHTFIVVASAAYRSPDDPRPGIGIAWERFPGKTPFTRDSELQNAETSAWGRAIVATLAADTKRGIASADEVRARRAADKPSAAAPPSPPVRKPSPDPREAEGMSEPQRKRMMALFNEKKFVDRDDRLAFTAGVVHRTLTSANDLTSVEASLVIDALTKVAA